MSCLFFELGDCVRIVDDDLFFKLGDIVRIVDNEVDGCIRVRICICVFCAPFQSRVLSENMLQCLAEEGL